MTTSASAPAGWYPDPSAPGQERLFDGVTWTDEVRPPRQSFSAPYANPALGWTLIAIGAVIALGIVTIPISAGLIAWGVYVLRGKGTNPEVAARRAQERLAAEAAYGDALAALRSTASPAQRVVLVRRLRQAAGRAFGSSADQVVADALASIGIAPEQLESPHIGNLGDVQRGVWVEVHRDWVIRGDEAYDVDQNTRMSVHLDGSVQIVPKQVKRGDRIVTVTEQHDLRRAEVHFTSTSWSLSSQIDPDRVGEARMIADRLAAHVATLRPAAATAADISAMVDRILENTAQPPAEKLKQLSNLRFDRLLSDAEFQRAKERILGLQG